MKAVDFRTETFLPGHRMEFRAITQEGENLSTETEDSVKTCSREITEKVKLVSTSVIKSAFEPELICLNISVLHHRDTRHRCFQSVSCCCFFSEFGLQHKDTVLCIHCKPIRSAMVLS